MKGLQPANPGEYGFCETFYHLRRPEPEHRAILRAGKFAGDEKQLIPELLKGEILPGFIQTVSQKCSDQIVREADDLQVERLAAKDPLHAAIPDPRYTQREHAPEAYFDLGSIADIAAPTKIRSKFGSLKVERRHGERFETIRQAKE
ncbi:MAG: hypothetical protein ACYCPS_06665 [Candidatus Saccharimonadales bacterium]